MDSLIFKLEIIASKWFEFMAATSIQLGLFLLLIFIIASIFKNQSARFLYFVWLIGLLKIFVPPTIKLPIFISSSKFIMDNQIPSLLIPEIHFTTASSATLSFHSYLFIAWIAVVLWLIGYWLFQLIQFRLKVTRHCIEITDDQGLFDKQILNGDKIRIFTGNGISMPFTSGIFQPKIYLPESALGWQAAELKALVLHEYAHIKRRDLLFIALQNVVKLLFFFHPLVWLANRQISRYREKACDDFAIQALQGKALEYGKLLLKSIDEALDWKPIPSMSTYFHQSKKFLLNRFHYILNRKENIMTQLNLSQKLVLIGLMLVGIVFSCQKKEQPSEPQQVILTNDIVIDLSKATLQAGLADSQKVDYDKPPMPVGGYEVLKDYLLFPEFGQKQGSTINAYINQKGEVYGLQYMKSSEEVMKNIKSIELFAINKFEGKLSRALSRMKWIPATKDGKAISAWITLPIQYTLKISPEEIISPSEVPQPPPPTSGDEAAFFVAYDEPPEPIGGFAAIQQNLIYPEIARRAGIEGQVTIYAQIGVNGEVVNTRILKSLGENNGCDEAAVAAIKAVKWQPAKQRGKPVTVWVSIPVKFKIQGDHPPEKRLAIPSEHTDAVEKIEAQPLTYTPPAQPPDDAAAFFVAYDKPPMPIGGFEAIQRNLVYPELARKAGIEGQVTVYAKIDESGDVIDTKILVPLGESGCNEAAVAAIKSVKWKPARMRGEPVAVWVSVPVKFKLH